MTTTTSQAAITVRFTPEELRALRLFLGDTYFGDIAPALQAGVDKITAAYRKGK
jgi:hypothetical protein